MSLALASINLGVTFGGLAVDHLLAEDRPDAAALGFVN